ncbi:MAG: hypothetical protein LBD76_02045 [Prevotellaceae bacterium]|jgi:hypothetical protein|nr:hypothetical protein [Prevotellaceae bacterium]
MKSVIVIPVAKAVYDDQKTRFPKVKRKNATLLRFEQKKSPLKKSSLTTQAGIFFPSKFHSSLRVRKSSL